MIQMLLWKLLHKTKTNNCKSLKFQKFDKISDDNNAGKVDMPHNHKENNHGHRICFGVQMSGVSGNPNIGV